MWAALAGAAGTTVQSAGLRPEHLHIVQGGQGIPASVVLAEHLGDSSILHLKVDGVADLLNAKVGPEHSGCEAGLQVGLAPDAAWALTFDADGRAAA